MFFSSTCYKIPIHAWTKSKLSVALLKNNTYYFTTYIYPTIRNSQSCFKSTNNLLRPSHLNINLHARTFQTSKPRNALSPIIWVILHRVLELSVAIAGIGVRRWWTKLSSSQQRYFMQNIQNNGWKFYFGAGLSGGLLLGYYLSHLVEDPITKRKRFLVFSEEQLARVSSLEREFLLEKYKNQLITSGQRYSKVLRVTRRVLDSNKSFFGTRKSWQLFLVDDMKTMSAFVLPSGQIFVFTGILTLVGNDDQLAAVVAHEMAHAFLAHSAEAASNYHLLELLMLLPVFAIWTLLPGLIALAAHFTAKFAAVLLFQLPLNRRLELEADSVGLEMMSRACYDPRQARELWKEVEALGREPLEWLSTHPTSRTRWQNLDTLMPKAFKTLADNCLDYDDNNPLAPRK